MSIMKVKEDKINDLDQLRLEIVRLKMLKRSQEAYLTDQYEALKDKVDAPVRFFNRLISWVPGVDVAKSLFANTGSNGAKKDWVSKIFSVMSTALLNRLFLRRAGLIKRLLFSTATQQAAGMINKDTLTSMISSLAGLIRNSGSKKSRAPRNASAARRRAAKDQANQDMGSAKAPDFGVPPDCEAS